MARHIADPEVECVHMLECGGDEMLPVSVCSNHWEDAQQCIPCSDPQKDCLPAACSPCIVINNQATVQLNILAVSFTNQVRLKNHVPPGATVTFDGEGLGKWKFFVAIDDCEFTWRAEHSKVELAGQFVKFAAPTTSLAYGAGVAVAGGIVAGTATYVGAELLVEVVVSEGQRTFLMSGRASKIREMGDQALLPGTPEQRKLINVLKDALGDGSCSRALQDVTILGVATIGEKLFNSAFDYVNMSSAIDYLKAIDKIFTSDNNLVGNSGSHYVITGGFIPDPESIGKGMNACKWEPLKMEKGELNRKD